MGFEFNPSVFVSDFRGKREQVDNHQAVIPLEDLDSQRLHVSFSSALQGRVLLQRVAQLFWIALDVRARHAVDRDAIAVTFQRGKLAFAGLQLPPNEPGERSPSASSL